MTENIQFQIQEPENTQEPTSANLPGIVFTRYLYIKKEVEHSFINAILKKDRDQALFWGYELYYSGFRFDLVELLSNLYDTYYSHHTRLEQFLNEKCVELFENPERDWIIGILILNMVYRELSSSSISIHSYILYIMLNAQDIVEYKTVAQDKYISRCVLKNVCKYTPCRKVIEIDEGNVNINIPFPNILYGNDEMKIEDKYYFHWTYYAAFSPIWKQRIVQFGGMQNHKNKTIDFPDDEQSDGFYDLYQYEPDEQSRIVKNNNIPIIAMP